MQSKFLALFLAKRDMLVAATFKNLQVELFCSKYKDYYKRKGFENYFVTCSARMVFPEPLVFLGYVGLKARNLFSGRSSGLQSETLLLTAHSSGLGVTVCWGPARALTLAKVMLDDEGWVLGIVCTKSWWWRCLSQQRGDL